MNKYNQDSNCPKCDSKASALHYHARTTYPVADEYIKRTCVNCGYIWRETPLDKDET